MSINRWIGTTIFLGTFFPGFRVSGKPAMKVAYNESYQPLSYKKDSVMEGLEIELMNEFGKKADIEIINVGFPWERAQAMVAEGKVDAFLTISTPARLKYSVMSNIPMFASSLIAVTSSDNPRLAELLKITKLEDTLDFHQVNHLGSGWAKALLSKARVEYLGSVDSIFKFLLAKRADIFIENDVSIGFNIKRLKIQDKVVILPAVFSSVEFRLGVSNLSSFSSQMKFFEKTIEKMKSDGSIERILEKYLPNRRS